MKSQKILYLHGFNSSPESYKAKLVRSYLEERSCSELLLCPQIPVVPEEARVYLEQLVEETLKDYQLNYIGSSLGGYYATYLAEKYSANAVLINPSVRPFETLKAYLGENKFYFEDGCWEFERKHIEQLKNMHVETLNDAQRYLVLLQTGDETLDYREAEARFNNSHCVIEQGGDHAFKGLERHLADIMRFSGIECD